MDLSKIKKNLKKNHFPAMKKNCNTGVTSANEGFLLALIQKQGFLAPVVSPRGGFWDLDEFFLDLFYCSLPY